MTEQEAFEPEAELEEVEPEAWPEDRVDESVEGAAGYEEVAENGDGDSDSDDFGLDLVSEEDQTS